MKISGCEYPEDLLYDIENGTWARKEGGSYRIGLAPQMNWVSGGYSTVAFKPVGARVEMGKSLGSVEGPKHFDVVRAPFDCAIASLNDQLMAQPKLVNKYPYGTGWFVIVEHLGGPSLLRPLADVSGLLGAKLKELGVRCFSEFPDQEMFEIGVECSAVIVKLNDTLAGLPSGTVVHLVSDDPTSDIEVERWKGDTGNDLLDSLREGNLHHFVVRKK